MFSAYFVLLFLLSAVIVSVYGTDPPPVKKMGAVLISPMFIPEDGKTDIIVNMTYPDGMDGIVPRGKYFEINVNCWGFQMSTPARGITNNGQTWSRFGMWTLVKGKYGPTRCEAHIEYQNKIYYRVEGEPGEQTGFVGPTISPKPAKTVFQKYLDFTSYNMTAGATTVIKIGMEHDGRWLTD
eukprot:Platyproteum_vivax@DN7610_c2_g1_i1.p1